MKTLRRLSYFGLAFLPLLVLAGCGDDLTDYPSAGDDVFDRTTATVEIDFSPPEVSALPGAAGAFETIELAGPMTVARSDPFEGDDGRATIDTEIVSMELTGEASFGTVVIRPNPDRASLGQVIQHEAGNDFPADSFFDIFVEVEMVDLDITARTDESMRMEATLTDLPPGEGDEEGDENVYRLSTGEAVPLIPTTPGSLAIGRISDAIHIPNPPTPPPPPGETPEATAEPTPTEAPTEQPTEEPATQQVTVQQGLGCDHVQPGIMSLLLAFIHVLARGGGELPLEGATVVASADGPGVIGGEETQSGVTDANGEVQLEYGINLFGEYTVTIDSVTGPDGNPLEIAAGSDTSLTYEVGDICTLPFGFQ